MNRNEAKLAIARAVDEWHCKNISDVGLDYHFGLDGDDYTDEKLWLAMDECSEMVLDAIGEFIGE